MTSWKAFDEGKPWAKVGDRVAFAKYGGFILEDEKTLEKVRVLNDEDVVAIWREE
jgi:co-chaperonin GroES (HSP10)